ncbi:MAG: hypothetical protein NC041_04720 [Bacteroides sp.]|nr:hypothetical protein [Prevotella sp.]MCM1407262.1 hypothetical protein [Treponema brennaborense]MCM1469750.1 hypothetical protein [Bacteroides sp.]
MKNSNICRVFFSAALLAAFLPLAAQTAGKKIAYYAVVSNSADAQTLKMAQDLFYSRLSAFPEYTIIDKRSQSFSRTDSENGEEEIALYAEIQEQNGTWLCTLNAFDTENGVSSVSSHSYESYYKILLDAKPSLSALLTDIAAKSAAAKIGKNSTEQAVRTEQAAAAAAEEKLSPSAKNMPSLEFLSGTWKGEEHIDKIILLRSGRGFIIFKNGATMNIAIHISGSGIKIVQTSAQNASFFPELTRSAALKNAAGAPPIEWLLSSETENTLAGTKKTLAMENTPHDSQTETVTEAIVPVTWERQ